MPPMLKVVSYNLHGLNQGRAFLQELHNSADVILIQEHWCAPFNLHYLHDMFTDMVCFASSSMNDAISRSVLRGRPFGGLATFVSSRLSENTKLIKMAERFTIIKVHDFVIVNIYMPCSSVTDYISIYEDTLACIANALGELEFTGLIIGGDWNMELMDSHPLYFSALNFTEELGLKFIDDKIVDNSNFTYRVFTTGARSNIDHFAVSSNVYGSVMDVLVLDNGINLSDHCAVLCSIELPCACENTLARSGSKKSKTQYMLRWDKSNIDRYCDESQHQLGQYEIPNSLFDDNITYCASTQINKLYEHIVSALSTAADRTIVKRKNNFYKFWWDQELDLLKSQAIESFQIWVTAGRPRAGPFFVAMKKDKLAYKRTIKSKEHEAKHAFTNSLDEALMNKNYQSFWTTWRAKFSKNKVSAAVDGLCDDVAIASHFASLFRDVCIPNSAARHEHLKAEFECTFNKYTGSSFDANAIDVELISKCIDHLKLGKAAGLDGLTAEHVVYAHSMLLEYICQLFRLMIRHQIVPAQFGKGVTIPLVKNLEGNRADSDNYRGITLSPVISKLFELVLMNVLQESLNSDWLQFGFKPKSSCSHALHVLRSTIDYYCQRGETVTLCALDISKAFDRTNNYALLSLLMKRNVPRHIIGLLLHWVLTSFICVRWNNCLSEFVPVTAGVRQGGILSPVLFAIYMDTLINRLRRSGLGCKISGIYVGCLLYADDIMLLSNSVMAMQSMLEICDEFALDFDVKFNNKKSVAMRIGTRWKAQCAQLILGHVPLAYVSSCKYLGVQIVSGKSFGCSVDNARHKFYRMFNCLYSRTSMASSELLTIQLMRTYCLPVLLYGMEAVSIKRADVNSLNRCLDSVIYKVFSVREHVNINFIRQQLGLGDIGSMIIERSNKFMKEVISNNNLSWFTSLCC